MGKTSMKIMSVYIDEDDLFLINQFIGPTKLHPNVSEYVRYAINWYIKMVLYHKENGTLSYKQMNLFDGGLDKKIMLCKFKDLVL